MAHTNHAEHFLKRVDRLDSQQAELALGLYRDHKLVHYILANAKLPDGAPRVALALNDDVASPVIVVTRDGKFVTCLGKGMLKPERLPVVTRQTLTRLSAKAEALRSLLAKAKAGGRHHCDRLLKRLLTAGPHLSQEEFDDLETWSPLLRCHFLMALAQSVSRTEDCFKRLQRNKRIGKQAEGTLRSYWQSVWAMTHLATLVGSDPTSVDLLSKNAPADAQVADAFKTHLLKRLTATELLAPTLRGSWLSARAPHVFLGPLKRASAKIQNAEDILTYGLSLAAIGHRHQHYRAEVCKALSRKTLSEDPSLTPLVQSLTQLLVHCLHNKELQSVREYPLECATALGEAFTTGVDGPHGAQILSQLKSTVKVALTLSLPTPLALEATDVQHAVFHVPSIARLAARDFYVPAEYRELFIESGYHSEDAQLYVLPRLLTAQRRKPAPYSAPNKPGRNTTCTCSSGKKYKRCCGMN